METNQGKDTPKPTEDKSYRPPLFDLADETLAATADYRFDADVAESPEPKWNKPQPIEKHLIPVSPLEPDMIPKPLRPWLCDVAQRMKCPLDFVAATAVVMISSLIGTRLTIKPKTRDDWTVVPNLWGAVIGEPSTMKTPSISEVLKPLSRLVAVARADFEEALAQYERTLVEYEAQKKAYAAQAQDRHKGKKIDNPTPYPEAPTKPKERRYMVNDTTVEKLADLLNENPVGLLQLRDELTGLLASWDRAGHEQDRAFHLEAWNGSGSMTIDRIGRGTTHVNVICESLFGGIQPAKLLPYLHAATGYENDGFVQRLQIAVFPDRAQWEYVDDYPDKAARDKAYNLVQQIADADFKAIGFDTSEFEKFPFTRFDITAQDLFKQWLTDWETNVLPNERGLLQEHFTKYRSLMPALALIFHVINCVANPAVTSSNIEKQLVTIEAAQMAVKWCDYLMSHARRIYGLLITANIESAKELIYHLKKGDLKDGFKARDVYRKQWMYLTTSEQAEAALSQLVTHHYIVEVQSPQTANGRPPAPYYLINPKI
ncbi:YfjI family protein [Fibrella arboris]|uniref:YfjI family protein n=1 Tax=Fibrella arboris TaxID=3242486 RepID=UPI00351FC9C1